MGVLSANNSKENYPKVYLYRRIVQAKLYIDANYPEKIDLDNISDEASFSKYHFIRLFKSIYGRTPYKYLIYVRVEKAKELLKAGHSVQETCFMVGFDSLTSFSGLFKKTVGVAPSIFLDQNRKTRDSQKHKPLAHVPGCYAFMHGWTENSNS